MTTFATKDLSRSIRDIDAEIKRLAPAIESMNHRAGRASSMGTAMSDGSLRDHVKHLEALRAHQEQVAAEAEQRCTDEILDDLWAEIHHELRFGHATIETLIAVPRMSPLAIRVLLDPQNKRVTLIPDPEGWLPPNPIRIGVTDPVKVRRQTLRRLVVDEAHMLDLMGAFIAGPKENTHVG